MKARAAKFVAAIAVSILSSANLLAAPDDAEADDAALEDTDDLADEADDIEVEVEDDKGEGDR